jgi:glutaredoxin
MAQWIIYSKPDCSLCDTMQIELASLLAARSSDVQVVDITGKPELERLYGKRVPALTINGKLICYYHLNQARVARYLDDSPAALS